jgi:hypothetical protein
MKAFSLLFIIIGLNSMPLHSQKLGDLFNKAKKVIEGNDLSEAEIGNGLQEALVLGVGEAVDFLSVEDGYYKSLYKILLPEDAQIIIKKLSMVPGFGNLENDLVERMNRAAEHAAVKAKPIFVSAITGITFEDGLNILTGEPDAATRYLEKATYEPLYGEFQPVIVTALEEVNASSLWKDAVTAYNKVPFVKKMNPSLEDHVTSEALKGLFSLIQKKEQGIRSDVDQRSSELLRKVFARQDK